MFLALSAVAIVALVLRFAIGITVGSGIPENPIGFTALDALLMALVTVGCLLFAALWALGARYRAVDAAMRKSFPASVVLMTPVLPSIAEAVREATDRTAAPEPNTVAAVVLSSDECSWWAGSSVPRCVARIRSDTPLTFRAGKLEHFGAKDALIVTARVEGIERSLPIHVLTGFEERFLPRPLRSSEISDLIASPDFGSRLRTASPTG